MTDCLCWGPVVHRDLSLSFFYSVCLCKRKTRHAAFWCRWLLLLLMGGHEETDPIHTSQDICLCNTWLVQQRVRCLCLFCVNQRWESPWEYTSRNISISWVLICKSSLFNMNNREWQILELLHIWYNFWDTMTAPIVIFTFSDSRL